ncbi:PTS lactose/cellobiose transporter subunit IIA [Peribacillus alkalitolerans]|uniref:PTS lactose/cellobiose transporter subunit IIA n=1 Tax=Peribacillus alkalitolerans TaxID=1550385 RepID=UPI0013D412EA|nr:PTS lactose/cellobiose transporter subunit IIA [Peribacillus alkalitolerans]
METINLEMAVFEIISFGGNAKSLFYEALNAAENNDFDKAEELMKEGSAELNKAHNMQTKLIQFEINGGSMEKTLLLIHAQDHLMTTISEQSLIERMIKMNKKIMELSK